MNFMKKVGINFLKTCCTIIIPKIKNDMLAINRIMVIMEKVYIGIMNSNLIPDLER